MAAIQSQLTANYVAFHAWCNIIVNAYILADARNVHEWKKIASRCPATKIKTLEKQGQIAASLVVYSKNWYHVTPQ